MLCLPVAGCAAQESGGLEKFMAKRRRKNASKEHKRIPSARKSGEDEA